MEDRLFTDVESTRLSERFSLLSYLYVSCMLTVLAFLATFPFVYYFKFHLFSFLTFLSSYLFTYILLLVIITSLVISVVRHRALHKEKFSHGAFFGIEPRYLLTRTGVRWIDWVGLIAAIAFSFMALFVPALAILLPLFVLLACSFLFALVSGSTKRWFLEPRGMQND